jgi:Asp-tRNA(Asn)/Glu-tRNA(Gln) amidotransferase A subunit family amidase
MALAAIVLPPGIAQVLPPSIEGKLSMTGPAPTLRRRAVLLAPLLLAACVGSAPQPEAPMPPLRYDYLTKLRLNVASIEIRNDFVPGPGDVSMMSPDPAVQALAQMARDRLVAAGSSGRAVFVIENASIVQSGNGALTGNLAVRLDIDTSDGTRAAYAEAQVSRIRTLGDQALTPTLYDMTRQMMDDLNVEFEYQLRHSLGDWLLASTPTSAPPPVQQQALPPS